MISLQKLTFELLLIPVLSFLSENLILEIIRDGKVYNIEFENGIVSKELKQSNEVYHKGKKRDGTKRKITSHRALFLQESKDHYWCGWRRKWSKYHNNWDLLEN